MKINNLNTISIKSLSLFSHWLPSAMALALAIAHGDAFDNSDLNVRNSFHWGSRQYEALSTTNLSLLSSNDFRKAHLQHWLAGTNSSVGSTLSLERESSPDSAGTIEGQRTWYDYAGKTNSEYEGTQVLPLYVARVLPDGTTAFNRTDRNALGYVLTNISTYSASGSVAYRTNYFGYAANGIDLLTAINALGVQVSSNAYNAFHEVTNNYDALNERSSFLYNTNQQLIQVIAPNGQVTTNTYGTDHFLAQLVVTGFATNAFTYANDLLLTHTDPRGLNTTNTWDNLNRLTGTMFPDGSSISNRYTILDLTASKDRMGSWTYLGYDNMRRNTSITNALNNVTTLSYCTCGALESTVDALTNLTQFNYDNQGNLTNTLYADGYSVTRTYNLLRQVVNSTDSGGNGLTTTFNNQGLTLTVSNIFGQVSAYAYDVLDRATNTVDANGVSINTTYDSLNRPFTRSYPDSGVESWAYTLNVPNTTVYTNQVGKIVTYAYDTLNRKTYEVAAGVSTNQYFYSGAGDLLKLIDGKNQTNAWNFDTFGRVTNKVDAAGNIVLVYKYDADNRLTNRWSIAKTDTFYRYDAVGNVTNIIYPVSTNVVLRYDVLNRLTNMVDGVGNTVFGYNAASLLLSEDGPWTNDTITYFYSNRMRTGLSLLQPSTSAWTESYGYDSIRRLTSLTSAEGTYGYTYDPVKLLRMKNLSLPNGANIVDAYDNLARLTGTALKNSGGTILDQYKYGYNEGSQRLNVTRTAGDYVNYTYDNIGELKTALGSEANGTARWQEQLGYTYDAARNLNNRTNNAVVQNFNVNQLNELTNLTRSGTFTVAGTTSSGATNVTVNTSNAVLYVDHTFASTNQTLTNGVNTFTAVARDFLGNIATNVAVANLPATNIYVYDLNGNLRTNGNQVLDYDDENQLMRVSVTNGWKNEFVYDGKLRRRIERDFTWSGGVWLQTNEIHFIYDGNVVLQERDTNNVPLVTYTRGLGRLLARTDANGPVFYHADGNANIAMLVDKNQAVVARYLYDPFGNTLSISGPMASANTYRFASKEWHANTGFYYFGRRFFDPNTQRWLNRDPIEEEGGLNLYGYVGNNPINAIDRLGLSTYFDENYGDISSYQNPANLPVVGAYVGVGVAAGLAVTGVGLAVEAYGASILGWLGLGTAVAESPEGQAELNEAEQVLANAANTVKSCPAPSLVGNSSPTQSILKAVYNADTRQIAVQFPATQGTHAEIAVDAGWGESPNLIGGYLNFFGGNITSGDWLDASGLLPGTPELVTQAQAATQVIMSNP